VNDKEKHIIIFSCHTNLKFLSTCSRICVDGTFSYCTKFFKQLFTIHGYKNGHYVPLVFALLTDKTVQTYEHCLQLVTSLCSSRQLIFAPIEIVIDFEKAIHQAVLNIWPNVIIIECRFHLTQAWWRKIQHLGLTADYKDKQSEIGKWLRYAFGLLYLNPSEVGDCFAFDLYDLIPSDSRVEKFADYLVNTYIDNNSEFPPQIWAKASSSTALTTNACESFHSHFNESFHSSHPSLYVFVEILLGVQIDNYIKINSVEIRHKSNATTLKKQKTIDMLLNLYKSNSITRIQFIQNVCHNFEK
jgi:hypothetical protein